MTPADVCSERNHLKHVREEKLSSTLQGSSGWTDNQINMRPISRRKTKFNSIYVYLLYTQERPGNTESLTKMVEAITLGTAFS